MASALHLSVCSAWLLAGMPGVVICQGSDGDVTPTGATSPGVREQAWQQHMSMAKASPFAELSWRSIGPRKQGGRIEAIACHPSKTSVIYVGAGSGNLWKSVNNGTTWRPVFDSESTFAIGDVAVAPSNPDIVWVGTGERLMARSSYAGTGIFKSTDAGKSWTNMGLRDSHHIGRLVIHPKNPDIVYAAVIGHMYSFNEERGLYRTRDGGKTWKRILYVDTKTGVIDVVMDPSDPDLLFASTWQRDRKAWGHEAYGPGSGLHRTSDGGDSWSKLAGGLPVGEAVGRIGVDIARSDPKHVYAAVDVARGSPGEGVYRSVDRGQTWRKVNQRPVSLGYDFCLIRVSPDDPDEIYLPGQKTMQSTDGGKTYWQVTGTLVHLLEHGSKVLHLDAHALWIDPGDSAHLLLGNDGGLHQSYDRGESWLHLNNIPIGEFYAVGYDMAKPYRILGGTQDNAALVGASDQQSVDGLPDAWQHVYLDPWGGGDSYFTIVDPSDPNTIYYEHQFGALRRKNMLTGKTVSIKPRSARGLPRLRFNWMTPFFLSHYDSKTVYYGANRLFKSVDRGDTWKAISPDLSKRPKTQGNVPYGTLTSLSESTLAKGMIYAATDDGNVQVTKDDGANWTKIDAGLPAKWVSRVCASRHVRSRVFVSLTGYREDDFSSYVYRSDDAGRTWTSISSGLPGESVNVIAEDPTHPDVLYVGTDLGCYTSVDGGKRWHSLRSDLPTTPVHDLFVHPRAGELVIGTHGRSIYVLGVEPIRKLAQAR
ncbi:MAG: hypothetical protein VX951_13090 [Planctomycetota bacterium]|nr:hypothetical protein [Planctomycetota bacterium]